LEPEAFERVKTSLAAGLRPGTVVLPMARGRLDPSLVLDGPGREEIDAHPRHDHDHDDDHDHDHHDHAHVVMESLVVRRSGHWERAALEAELQRLLIEHPVVRLKGRLRQAGKRLPLQIQGVGRRLECWYEERAATPAAAEPVGAPGEQDADGLELVVLATAGAACPLRQALDRL